MDDSAYLQLDCIDNAALLHVIVPNRFSTIPIGEGRDQRGKHMPDFNERREEIMREVAERLGLATSNQQHALRMVLEEGLANNVKHGDGIVSLEWGVPLNDPTIEYLIRMRDEGDGFDPHTIPNPNLLENLEKPSGHGLQLIQFYADKLQCVLALIPADPNDPQGNRNGFEFRFRKPESPVT